jgi:hypothetical protein
VFELPAEMRASIKSEELRTLFEMCDREGTGRIALVDVQVRARARRSPVAAVLARAGSRGGGSAGPAG